MAQYLFWFDLANRKFLSKKQLGEIDIKELEIVQIDVEVDFYSYKWQFIYKGVPDYKFYGRGSVQAFIKYIKLYILSLQVSQKPIPFKEESKLFELYTYF